MKLIKITKGKFVQVDDADFEFINQFRWFAHKRKNIFYARGKVRIGEATAQRYMHRQIMNAKIGEICDHKDGNGLNNQRSNLRICTQSENIRNQRPRSGFSSQYKGVFFHKVANKWTAQIKINYKRTHLGLFISEKDAALKYDEAAKKFYGEFAKLNFQG